MPPRSRLGLGLAADLALGLAASLALGLGACTDDSEPPPEPAVISGVSLLEIPIAANRELDVLFVIDSSPGIAPQRAKLLASYRQFMETIEAAPGGIPDLHLGVITADLGTRGPADTGPGPVIGTGPGSCTSDGDRGELRRGASVLDRFISIEARPDGTYERNYTGSLADAFTQLADVGESGCAYVRPFEAARRALSENPVNGGFLRERAALTVIFVTNTDDCSFGSSSFTGGQLDPSRCATNGLALVGADEYAAFLRSLKRDPQNVLVLGAFAPGGAPACADASPAPRLSWFADNFPYRSDVVSICEPDLDPLSNEIVPPIKILLGAPCLDPVPLDRDAVTPGLQPECAVWYSYVLDGARVEELIPACGDAPPTASCWQVKLDPATCGSRYPMFALRNQRRFGLDAQAITHVQCVSR